MRFRHFRLRDAAPLAVAGLLCLASGSIPAHAETVYVNKSQINLSGLLPPPPSPQSSLQQRDLKTVLDAQASRTDAQIARAKATADLSVFNFSDVLGPHFNAAELPKTAAFFQRVYDDSLDVLQDGKKLWSRPRPFLVSGDIQPLEKPKSGSYPSGNALLGYLYAIILADLVPEKKAELFARGDETGDNRIVAGVHFPSDLEAGRRVAVALAVALAASPAYRTDLAAAKAELREKLGL